MRILTIDIECFPNEGWFWDLWDQNISTVQIETAKSVCCFAARWYGEKRMHFYSDFHDGHDVMVAKAWELMDEADAIVGWNSKGFDVKHLHWEFGLAKLGPPSDHKDIDLLQTMRTRFKAPSNKLDYVAQTLIGEAKVKHVGFDLWKSCMAGDAKSWAQMKRYNVHDVKITEALYVELLPWIRPHPHLGLYGGDKSACPRCGSVERKLAKNRTTPQGTFPQWRCIGCGGYYTGTSRIDGVKTRAA